MMPAGSPRHLVILSSVTKEVLMHTPRAVAHDTMKKKS